MFFRGKLLPLCTLYTVELKSSSRYYTQLHVLMKAERGEWKSLWRRRTWRGALWGVKRKLLPMKVTLEEENLKGSTVRSEEEITANAIWRGFKECQDRDYLWWTDWGRHFVERKRWWEHWLHFAEVGCLPLLSAFSARWRLFTDPSTLQIIFT